MKMLTSSSNGGPLFLLPLIIALSTLLPSPTLAYCYESGSYYSPVTSVVQKLWTIPFTVLIGTIGLFTTSFGTRINLIQLDSEALFILKACYAVTILLSGFVQLLPEATLTLTCICKLNDTCLRFPVSGIVAMGFAIFALIVDVSVVGFLRWRRLKKAVVAARSAEDGGEARDDRVTSTEDYEARGNSLMVLAGLFTHSLVIGISLGTNQNEYMFNNVLYVVRVQQFCEGLRLGASIFQADFSGWTTAWILILFYLTTPAGLGVGLWIWSLNKGKISAGVKVEGIFYAASAGMLIYRGLVNVIMLDFFSKRMVSSFGMQVRYTFYVIIFGSFFIFLDIGL